MPHRAPRIEDYEPLIGAPAVERILRKARAFTVKSLEPYRYTVEDWIEPFRTWRRGLARKAEASQVEPVDLLIGAGLVEEDKSLDWHLLDHERHAALQRCIRELNETYRDEPACTSWTASRSPASSGSTAPTRTRAC